MYSYDFDEFIGRVKDFSYREMLDAADREARSVEPSLHGKSRVALVKQAAGGPEYRKLLGGFIFLLGNGTKPDGVSNYDFPRMRPAIESLVRRGIMKREALSVFEASSQAAG